MGKIEIKVKDIEIKINVFGAYIDLKEIEDITYRLWNIQKDKKPSENSKENNNVIRNKKIRLLAEYKENNPELSWRKIAKKFKIDPHTAKRWFNEYDNRQYLSGVNLNELTKIKVIRNKKVKIERIKK